MNYTAIDISKYQQLLDEYKIHSLLAKVICSFDYTEEEIASFFSPKKELFFNEEVFLPIKKALEEIKTKKQKVFIFGDYDCDGLCSTTIMLRLLAKLNIEADFYIPDRLTEGYGLNLERLKEYHDKGFDVLVTVDNGVSAKEPLRWAKENGMTIIVTDHHIITSDFDYDYLLHPSIMGDDYQYLCGAGVVYMLAEYLGLSDNAIKALAMIATISDVMSLKGINIKIVNDGLRILNNHGFENINLLDNFNYPITEEDIGYRVAPKINSVGRLADLDTANANFVVHYLCLNNNEIPRMRNGAKWLNGINAKRQELSTAQSKIVEDLLDENADFNIIFSEQLHEGLLGLIASKISKQTNKITFVFTTTEGLVKGSGRGIKGVNLIELLEGFKDEMVHFGGHSQACGITLEKDNLAKFIAYVKEKLSNIEIVSTEPVVEIDLEELNYFALKELFNYRPFGQDRRIPLIKTTIKDFIGFTSLKNENQIKWKLKDISFISFSNNKGYDYYVDKDEIEVVGELKENNFAGHISYQVIIKEFID